MRRQSDIGWTELIIGNHSDYLWTFYCETARRNHYLDRNRMWSSCDTHRNCRYYSVCQNGTLYRIRSHPFSDNRNFECDGRFYADRSSRCRNLGDRNDSSNLDYCTLCLQTFPSSVYENAFWNNLLLYFDDFEYSRIDRRIPAGIPANDHDFFHGSTCGCLSDP